MPVSSRSTAASRGTTVLAGLASSKARSHLGAEASELRRYAGASGPASRQIASWSTSATGAPSARTSASYAT